MPSALLFPRADDRMDRSATISQPSTTISTHSSPGSTTRQWLVDDPVTRMGDSRSDQPSVVLRSAGADGVDRSRRVRRRRAAALAANGGTDASIAPGRSMSPAELVRSWREDRRRLIDVAARLDPSTRVPWYGPAMGARSFITARLMETWAHGQDVADALGVVRRPTARLAPCRPHRCPGRPFSYVDQRHGDAGRRCGGAT